MNCVLEESRFRDVTQKGTAEFDNLVHQYVTTNDICDESASFLIKDLETDTENTLLEIKEYSTVDELRCWAIECNIKHNHLDKLLNILRKDLITDLPKSLLTFLKTSGKI